VIGKRLEQKYPGLNQGFGISVFSLKAEDIRPALQLGLLVLQGFVGLVLLIACANLASLLLARAADRGKEIAVRSALGATRSRLIRQVLGESILLSLCGGVAGLVLAYWGMMALNCFTPQKVLGSHELTVDFSVFGFTFAVIVLAALLFGMFPALACSRPNINETLARNSRATTRGSGKLRSVLAVMEVSVAVLLVAGAGLMVRSLLALYKVNPGFDPDHVITASISLPPQKYSTPVAVRAFCAQLLDKAGAIPGVESAALASYVPMDDVWETTFQLEDRQGKPGSDYMFVDYSRVSENYFATLRMPIVRGRGFTRQETERGGPGVLIVNDSMARKYWPNQDALGKVILTPDRNVIVGIVADSRQLAPDLPPEPEMFFPDRNPGNPSILLRTTGAPAQLAAALTAQVLSIDKDLPVNKIRPLAEVVADTTSSQRFGASLMIAFALLALILASVGLYGVLAYLVSLQTPEIGIRMALGAQRAEVRRMVLRHGLSLALSGVLIGTIAALAASRVMSSLLFGITAHDAPTFLVTAGILLIVAMIATCVPAWRATRVDPMVALRYE
jgi:putative ABC transport system permease protein